MKIYDFECGENGELGDMVIATCKKHGIDYIVEDRSVGIPLGCELCGKDTEIVWVKVAEFDVKSGGRLRGLRGREL